LHLRRYLSNVAWSWGGVLVTLFVGFYLSPYIIRRVGDTQFGLWSLALSLVEYYWLIDLGLRSATVKYSAQFRAAGRDDQLNELLSTGLLYSLIAAAFLLVLSLAFAPRLGHLLHIDQPVFAPLVRIVGASWAVGLIFNRYGACLEGFQRFDISSRIWIISIAVRSVAILLLLHFGFGVVAMALALMGSQFLLYLLSYVELRTVFPAQNARLWKASVRMLKQMAAYGFHSFTALVSNRLLSQSVPFLLAYFLPVRYVSYYVVPQRLLDYAMEGIGRVGMVTTPSAAALQEQGGRERLVQLGIYTNRYCLTIYLPVTVLLWVYGVEFMRVWIRPDFAAQSAYLFRILLVGGTMVAGQFNSVSILFGMGTHKIYARSLFVEAILVVAGLAFAVPRYGLTGAAVVTSAFMLANRGILCGFLLSRELHTSFLGYMARIYSGPLAAAAATMGALFWVKWHWLPGRTWRELALAGAIFCLLYGVLAFRLSLTPEHRAMVLARLRAAFQPKAA
jgi:O-antigen/teichoic acid export membrane protein